MIWTGCSLHNNQDLDPEIQIPNLQAPLLSADRITILSYFGQQCVSIYLSIMELTGQEPVSGTRQKTRTAADRLLSSGVDFWRQRRAHQGP
jgi:hypothetical protein